MPLIVSFPGCKPAAIAEIGGKGHSLMRLAEAGLPVPPGAILTSEFFGGWFDAIRTSAPWVALAAANRDGWAPLCRELQALCPTLQVTPAQRLSLDDLRRGFMGPDSEVADETTRATPPLLAVRSSSPEEDMESASFAGGYETRLGVRPEDLEAAVRHCFAGSLAERVLVYKQEHGFDILSPRLAVVVQQQVDAEIAGVGFSLNPLTNDFDEAVIDANWGLGESVVAGLASPDHFVIDKVTGQVLERRPGAKQVSIWLEPDGGTSRRQDHRSREVTLDDAQLAELTGVLRRIETLYNRPADIEWAYAGGALHVLQARPVTAYVPLPAEMVTRPGERRRLYADGCLSKGMTINAPLSPLGLDWMNDFMSSFMKDVAGIDDTAENGLIFTAGGRMYINISNALWLGMRLKSVSRNSIYSDVLMGEILANVDEDRYRSATRPPWLRPRLLLAIPRMLWLMRTFFWNTFRAFVFPVTYHRAMERQMKAYEAEMSGNLDQGLSLDRFRSTYLGPMARLMFGVSMPGLSAGLISPDLAIPRNTKETQALADKLKLGFTGNVVVEMGIALFRLARLLDRSDFEDLGRLAAKIERRDMPADFLESWDAFVARHGCRGPLEMDLASPRYADDPLLALRQMSFMATDDSGFDPEVAHQRQVDEHRAAYAELLHRVSWWRRPLLRRIHRLIELFAGSRDMPKYQTVLLGHAVRQRALMEGEHLVREGRLDAAEDIFDLTFADVEAAANDPGLDLRQKRGERTRFLELLTAQVTEFPQVIDSRGRILRPPPRDSTPGELRGMAVSPGVATGIVKVLRDPHDQPINHGDVLVAYTTDPGWTPLFVNAAAVVLEIGGILQHGAVVAREYGKPCVAGIHQVMTRLQDGQWVEVDGTEGVVRILP